MRSIRDNATAWVAAACLAAALVAPACARDGGPGAGAGAGEPGLVPPPPIEVPQSAAGAAPGAPPGTRPDTPAGARGGGLLPLPGIVTRAATAAPAAAPGAAPAAAPSAVLAAGAEGAALAARLVTAVERVRTKAPGVDLAVAWDRAATAEADYVRFLRRAQVRFGSVPILLEDGRPAAAAAALQAAVAELEAHALDPAPYELERLTLALDRLGPLAAAAEEQRRGPFADDEGHALWEAALLALDGADRAGIAGRAAAAGDEDDAAERLPVVERWLLDAATADAAWRQAQAQADVLLVRTLVRYAMDFRYLRRTDPYATPDVFVDRLLAVENEILEHVVAARADMAATLAALRPSHPLYEQVRAFLPVYRAYAAGPEALRPQPFTAKRWIRKGISGPDVAALRERLRAEGFDPGPPGDRWDATLKAAVIAFQETRGLAPMGEVGPQTRVVLNVPVERRLQQIEISLQRWRERPIGRATGRYVRVNLPQYELQLWEDDRLVQRHKVIVGSGSLHTDLLQNTIGYLNRTHLVDSAIYQIIINPFWRVPKRIAVQEIGPEAESDPNYLKEKGFRIVQSGGEPLYVQAPGPHNPLGRVKFLFANDFALYLHDTDKRWLFKETQRDFSHGCIRVNEPLELAFALANATNGLPREDFDRLLRSDREHGIDLKTPVPIYLDYNTTAVDEAGRLVLLPDVYKFDRDALRGRLPVRDRRPMKPAEAERARQKLREKKKS